MFQKRHLEVLAKSLGAGLRKAGIYSKRADLTENEVTNIAMSMGIDLHATNSRVDVMRFVDAVLTEWRS
jgi:hypothetical protein